MSVFFFLKFFSSLRVLTEPAEVAKPYDVSDDDKLTSRFLEYSWYILIGQYESLTTG